MPADMMDPGWSVVGCQSREYTGAIAPAFGLNVITHDCGCGASAPGSDSGLGAHVPAVLIGIAAGIALALMTRGGAQ